ncbi:MAG: metallophosphoesterase [Burkholderiales bacterium]
MRLQLLSDLHLETDPGFVPQAAPGADLLVLAGDVGSYQPRSKLAGDDFGLERFSPLRAGAPWRRVLFVPGNHEYDALEFDATHARLRRTCERLGIDWLEREVLVIDGVRFIGTTLWSDFDALGQVPPSGKRKPADPVAYALSQRDKALRAANFFLTRNSTLRNGQPVLAQDMRVLGLACQAWLREALARPFSGRTVVVTHFAPSLRSADPRYGLMPSTAAFCNGLDDLLAQADLWLHGHLHCRQDYLVEQTVAGALRRCRVVANPLGYAFKHEQDGFDPLRLIDLPD